jgi:hypothetical protein
MLMRPFLEAPFLTRKLDARQFVTRIPADVAGVCRSSLSAFHANPLEVFEIEARMSRYYDEWVRGHQCMEAQVTTVLD